MSTFTDCSDNLTCATLSGSNGVGVGVVAGSPNKIVVSGTGNYTGNFEITGVLRSTGTIVGPAMLLSNSSGYANLEMGGPSGGFIDLRRPFSEADFDIRFITDNTIEGGGYLQASGGAVLALSGNAVGIGTKSPSEKLEVANTAGFSTIKVTANTTPNTTDEASIRLFSGLNGYTYAFYRENGSNFGIFHSGSAGPATKFRINNNGMSLMEAGGNVGIGTAAPTSDKLQISGPNDRAGLNVVGSVSTLNLGSTVASEGVRTLEFNRSNGLLKIKGGNVGATVDYATIDSNGNVGIGIDPPTSKLHVNGVITADSITFGSAGGSGTATGNLLSDYEEGTWTPTLKYGSNANSTITVTSAQYTKIGRTVTLGCEITVGAIVGTGQATLGGLPFAANSSTSAGGLFCIYFTGVSTVLNIVGKVTPSSSNILLYKTNAALATISNANNTELQTGSNVIFRIVYDT